MVEKTHTAGLWPALYEPFRNMGTRVAEWLAPASDASSDDSAYRISVELPGVSEKDIDVSVHDGVVSVKGEKTSEREEKGDTWFFSEWSCPAYVPVSQLIYAAFRSNAKGLLPPSDERGGPSIVTI